MPVITPSSALLEAGQTVQFSATANGQSVPTPAWSVNGIRNGNSSVGTISPTGLYTAPATATGPPLQIRVSNLAAQTESAPVPVSLYSPSQPPVGAVASTQNALVANYAVGVPQGATAQVQFGTTTAYGLTTWTVAAPSTGGVINVLVAGMRASTTYHMQATITLAGGQTVLDQDHTFTTGAIPANVIPNVMVQKTAGLTPSDGVEMLCLFEGTSTAPVSAPDSPLTAVVTDTEGNVIWYYPIQPAEPFPMKLLPNGHVLVVELGANEPNSAEEIDLAGNIVSQVTLGDLSDGLAAAGYTFATLMELHHDIVKLPNGHLIILFNFNQNVDGVGTVTADGLADWDPVKKAPVWAWSTMDHIPLSHAPNGTSDWTHANAVVYSPDDGNLLLSMRNQNWVVKINYQDGAGDGSILWHLGNDGDFTMTGSATPIEWNYGQHYPTFMSPNTTGVFSLMMFDNGNGRIVDGSGDQCGTAATTIACYSSVPTYQLNETTKTVEVQNEINLNPIFSFCCGNAEQLLNGDYEYDVADDLAKPGTSYIQEVTNETSPQLVWQMTVAGQLAYRGFRIPSLYPGVTWTQANMATANAAKKSPVKSEN